MDYDLVIIGSGPAGYVGAIKAAKLGKKVALIEKDKTGGVCLNSGCIPTKLFLQATGLIEAFKKSADYGINSQINSVDQAKLIEKKQKLISSLTAGIDYLLKANKVEVIKGSAKIIDKTKVEVKSENGPLILEAKFILIATGSRPVRLNIEGLGDYLDNESALNLNVIPKNLLIVGAGAIGIEFACIFRSLGSEVSVVELMEQILPSSDREIATKLKISLEKKGIKFFLGAKLEKITSSKALISSAKGAQEIPFENVLISVGRQADTKGLGLEQAGINTNKKGEIIVDNLLKTNIDNIYSAGDCIGGYQLAHVASFEAEQAVENMFCRQKEIDYSAVPMCIYSHPEVASVGITEEKAKEQGIKYKTGKFPFSANSKAQILGQAEGLVKVITDEQGKILGVSILGPEATDLIGEAALAINLGMKIDSIVETIHPHPTLLEAIREACLDVEKKAIHKIV